MRITIKIKHIIQILMVVIILLNMLLLTQTVINNGTDYSSKIAILYIAQFICAIKFIYKNIGYDINNNSIKKVGIYELETLILYIIEVIWLK